MQKTRWPKTKPQMGILELVSKYEKMAQQGGIYHVAQ